MAAEGFRRERHRAIVEALARFDADFMRRHGIGFGGGTRIALELDEYRESVDIDLICPTTASYRAVRETITTDGLGGLLRQPAKLAREVRADRYGVRTALRHRLGAIKLEILSFDEWRLNVVDHPSFPVPVIDRAACFVTKLTAANDRGFAFPYKDVFDLLAMRVYWGEAPPEAVAEAERHYGRDVGAKAEAAIRHLLALPATTQGEAAEALSIAPEFLARLTST